MSDKSFIGDDYCDQVFRDAVLISESQYVLESLPSDIHAAVLRIIEGAANLSEIVKDAADGLAYHYCDTCGSWTTNWVADGPDMICLDCGIRE